MLKSEDVLVPPRLIMPSEDKVDSFFLNINSKLLLLLIVGKDMSVMQMSLTTIDT